MQLRWVEVDPPSLSGAKAAAGVPAKLARRHALDFQKAAIEVGDVVEADVVADMRDVPV